jgi:DNA replication protein DnaC
MYEKISVLCLDDVGSELERAKHCGNDIDIIGHFLMSRCKDGLLTLATSNFPESFLEKRYRDRVVSRMHEIFNFITIKEKDFRM